ncbi:amylo-alpha-1,6-glucosidase [Streptomyces chiangmaiensis]
MVLLAEAWRWGMPQEDVATLLPHAERALEWLRLHADADGDGFVEYIRNDDNGLVNQGWKDSVDSVQSTRGRLASAPIALSEVQGYAYQAAVAGAALLSAFGRPGADYWLDWADALARRFRSAFWVEDAAGPYVAIALDGDKRPVDAVASNAGHLLGTGILSADESAAVAQRLAGPDMNSGWGLRTMSARSAGFNPVGYHTGSVWAHDTAIAVAGLATSGHHPAAASLIEGLLEAAAAFDYRLPELHGGEQRRPGSRPVPYPASCRPQAWAATAGISLLSSLLGLEPDLPSGRVALRPLAQSPVGSLEVSGIRLGTGDVTVTVDGHGDGSITGAPGSVHVETRPALPAASDPRIPRS